MVIPAETAPAPPPQPAPPPEAIGTPSRRGSFQSSLHNFDFPVLKTWGRHRVLRFLNVNRKGEIISGKRRSALARPSAPSPGRIQPDVDRSADDDAGSEEVRAKLFVHLREAAARINNFTVPPSKQQPEMFPSSVAAAAPTPMPASEPSSSSSPPGVNRPWNLRTRRVPIFKEPRSSASPPPPPPPLSEKSGQSRTVRLRSEGFERQDWPKISIPLTREDIADDIYAVTGSRPRRRPKKRPRIVQRQVDLLLPGSWLPSLSPDSYRVPDLA